MNKHKKLTKEQIEKINDFHILNIDKFYREWAGMASQLKAYKNGRIILEVENTGMKIKSTYNTAVSLANTWKKFNPGLSNATGFVVIFKKRTTPTGFIFRMLEDEKEVRFLKADEQGKLFETIERIKNNEVKIEKVYSGVLDEKSKQIEKDLVKND